MPVEIERKFLVIGASWWDGMTGQRFCQGYLTRDRGTTVRVRRAGPRAFITVKGASNGLVRPEFEYEIPAHDAEEMLADLCQGPLIEKTRYEVPYAGRIWHVDVFAGDNKGLVLAEIELDDPSEHVDLPPWIGREVTSDHRYRNSELSITPQAMDVP